MGPGTSAVYTGCSWAKPVFEHQSGGIQMTILLCMPNEGAHLVGYELALVRRIVRAALGPRWLRSLSAVMLLATLPDILLAQEQPPSPTQASQSAAQSELQEVVVTGTLLRDVEPAGSSVMTLSSQQIQATGATDSNQVLALVPAITNEFNSIPSIGTGGPLDSIIKPDIRGLNGTGLNAAAGSATLVLLDGHRMVGAGTNDSSPDPAVIPPGVLESVQVVTGGGSAIYGSDAVGGVINFITKKSFDGLEASASSGFTSDYKQYDFNVTGGKSWGSGSAYISYEFQNNTMLRNDQRSWNVQTSPPPLACYPGTVTVTNGGLATNYALPGLVPNTTSSCNQTAMDDYFPGQNRNSVFVGLNQDFSDRVSLDLKAYYTYRRSETSLDWNAQNYLAIQQPIDASNPYYEPIGTGQQTVSFSYAGVFSPRGEVDLKEFGVTPTLTVKLGGDWQLQTMLNYGHSTTDAGEIALNSTAQAAALAGTTTATALDPYDLSKTNPAVLSGILETNYGAVTQEMDDVRMVANGSVFNLPGGAIKLALGAEYLRNVLTSAAGMVPVADVSSLTETTQTERVNSLFGEVSIPIVGNGGVAGVRSLTLDASGRLDDYSDFGSTANPKVGLNWQITNWLGLDGNWATAFQAPSLVNTSDVGSTLYVLPESPFRLPSAAPSTLLDPTIFILGGNPDLKPETATTYQFGFHMSPPVVPGLRLTATYWNVNFTNQVASIPFTSPTVFGPQYSSWVFLNPSLALAEHYASLVQLIGGAATNLQTLQALYASGKAPYVLMDTRFNNLSAVKTDGIDFDGAYQHPTFFGSMNADISGTYTLSHKIAAVAGAAYIEELTSPGQPDLQLQIRVGASMGPVSGYVMLQHTNGYNLNPALPNLINPSAPPQTHVASFDIVNLYGAYTFRQDHGPLSGLQLTLNVDNLSNHSPSGIQVAQAVTGDNLNGFTLGRLFEVGLRKEL